MINTNDYRYSLRVKNGSGWRRFERIRLLISVGKEYHEGNKLAAVVDWINRNPSIKEVHISVNDLLQRHNLIAAGLSEKDAAARSLASGALWLTRNEDVLTTLRPTCLITRWKDWFSLPEFESAFSTLQQYKQNDLSFEKALEQDSHALAERKTLRGETVPPSLILHSRHYIEEEMALFAVQTNKLPAAEVYPGSNLHSATYFLENFCNCANNLPAELRPLAVRYFTRVDFARKKEGQTVSFPKAPNDIPAPYTAA